MAQVGKAVSEPGVEKEEQKHRLKSEGKRMQKNPAAEEVIRRLNSYYDAESEIEEELRTIEHAQEQRNRVSLRSPSLSGLPGGKGQHSDQTADLATASLAHIYDEDIKAAWARIAKLRADRNWVTAALAALPSRLDRRIIELAYLGPKEPERRRDWLTRPTWYAVAKSLGVSEAHARKQADRVIQQLAGMIDQVTMDF